MTYIHKLESILSSIFLARGCFSLPIHAQEPYHPLRSDQTYSQEFLLLARLHAHRVTCCASSRRHSYGNGLSDVPANVGTRKSDKRYEQSAPDRTGYSDLLKRHRRSVVLTRDIVDVAVDAKVPRRLAGFSVGF